MSFCPFSSQLYSQLEFITRYADYKYFYYSLSCHTSMLTSNIMIWVWRIETLWVQPDDAMGSVLTSPDKRSSNNRIRRSDPKVFCRREVCDHHPRRSESEGISAEGDVAESERYSEF